MLQKELDNTKAALFVLPKAEIDFITEIPKGSYYDYSAIAMLNPPFNLDDLALTGPKNHFIQNGRFLIQDYNIAGDCFYNRNKNIISKISITQGNLRRIYEEFCEIKDLDPDCPLVVETDSDLLYKFCEELNNLDI